MSREARGRGRPADRIAGPGRPGWGSGPKHPGGGRRARSRGIGERMQWWDEGAAVVVAQRTSHGSTLWDQFERMCAVRWPPAERHLLPDVRSIFVLLGMLHASP